MSIIIVIRDFQLYRLDIANKTAVEIAHEYANKMFVLVSEFYVVDTDHTIYKITEKPQFIFDVQVAIHGTSVANVKLLNNYILYSDTSDILHVIVSSVIIKINNLQYCDIEYLSEFFVSVHENMYIFVSYIVNNTFYIEIDALNGAHLGTFFKKGVQDFNFSKIYVYIICDNLVYRRIINLLIHSLHSRISDKIFTANFEKFCKIDTNSSNVVLLYEDIITSTNYISSHSHPVICVQNKKNVINYENNTGNLYHFQLSCDNKYIRSNLIFSHVDAYYNNNANFIVDNNSELDVYAINEKFGLTKIFSIEGKFCYKKNKVKPCKQ